MSQGLETYKAYKRIFSGPDGERVLEDLKAAHYFYSSVLASDDPVDPYKVCMAEAERNVVLRIMAILQAVEIQ